MTSYYLWLLQVMGPANPRSLKIIAFYGGVDKAYTAINGGDTSFLSSAEKKRLATASLEKSEILIERCKKKNVKIITLEDEDYPIYLSNIYNPPILLFVCGDISNIENEICISAVGARAPTNYSLKVSKKLMSDLAKLNVVLVSGLANGIDYTAHEAAIIHKGRTIGVLACGTDIDYPKGSLLFREEIIINGGAVISELLPHTKVNPNYFQQRNRIISGLSLGTVVVEASQSSGSLLTADHAIQQGRDLFCVPPADVFDPCYAGVVRYLRDGAIPVFNYLDIVREYRSAFAHKLSTLKFNDTGFSENHKSQKPKKANASRHNKAELKTDNKDNFSSSDIDLSNFNENEQRILNCLTDGDKTMDELIQNCGLSNLELCDTLIDLELSGTIKSLPGARYKIV